MLFLSASHKFSIHLINTDQWWEGMENEGDKIQWTTLEDNCESWKIDEFKTQGKRLLSSSFLDLTLKTLF
ncbi:hypothetical protein P8452_33461 [Trifolium repens]|nr:hypothetical protein P8452_33461 [Trifolium repens]